MLITWAASAGLAGLAGILYALPAGVVNPNLGFSLILSIFAAVVVGGIGNAYGALAGGLLIGLVQEWSTLVIDPAMKVAVGFAVLILVLLIRPQGLFGRGTIGRTDEWLRRSSASRSRSSRMSTSGSMSGCSQRPTACSRSGIQLNVGTTGIFNFGQAGFMAVGSYAMGVLVVKSGVSFWLALVAGIGVAVAAGLLVGLPSLRLRADYFAISTLAFSEIVRYVADNWDGLTGGNLGLFGYADAWSEASARIDGWLEHLGIAPHFLLPLLLVNLALLPGARRVRRAPRAVTVGARPQGDPRGRGRRARPGQEHVCLQAPVAVARRGDSPRSPATCSRSTSRSSRRRTSTRC